MAASLLDEIRKLSVEDRLDLVQEVWDSIEVGGDELLLPESHRQELARRRAAHRDQPDDVVPWEEVREQLWSEE